MTLRLESEFSEAERAALVRTLKARGPNGAHLEIGTAAAGALKLMMLSFPASERTKFVVVDPLTYFPNQREAIETNLAAAGIDSASVDFRVEKSAKALSAALRAS